MKHLLKTMDKQKCAQKRCDNLNTNSPYRNLRRLLILSQKGFCIINLYLSVNIFLISFLPIISRIFVVDCIKSRYGK